MAQLRQWKTSSLKTMKVLFQPNLFKKKLDGFTLVELLIYAAVVTVLLAVAATFFWQIIEGNIKTEANQEVEQNASFAMEKIVAAAKKASLIAEPANPGDQTDYLILTMPTPLEPVEFRLSNGQITIREGTTSAYPITADSVTVTQLRFTNLTAGTSSGETIKIEMTVSYKNPANRPEYSAVINLENSVSLRR